MTKLAECDLLFAERDPAPARSLRARLRRAGASVRTAGTFADLRAAGRSSPPKLIVLDAELDDVPPETLVGLVAHEFPRAGLVVLTDRPDERVDAYCRRFGVLHYGRRPPRAREVEDVLAPFVPGLRRLSAEDPRRAPLVLCVDDDPRFLESLQRLLESHGCRVAGFTDSARALREAASLAPDLAFVDLLMPAPDGMAVAGRLRDRAPVVMLTGRGGADAVAESYQRGASYYLNKPCSPRMVLNVVDYFTGDLDPCEKDLLECEL